MMVMIGEVQGYGSSQGLVLGSIPGKFLAG
jgi:hypothetical protein